MFALTLMLGGCISVGGAGRWIGSPAEILSVDGGQYQVQWRRDGDLLDTRTTRAYTLALIMPDEQIERRRSTQAALEVARRQCGPAAAVMSEGKDGDFYTTSFRCDNTSPATASQ